MDNFVPLISIIVPIYNVELYLGRCVDSLICQTYHNIEIILVDDGSPDRCGEICDEYAHKDNRIVVVHKPNGGLSDARNKGLDVAKGDYVMFVDSDDWIDRATCDTVVNLAVSNQSDIVIFGVRNVYDSGKVDAFPPKYSGVVSSEMCINSLLYKIKEFGIFNYACNKLFLKRLFDGIRFQKGRVAEDQGLTYKLFHKANRICVCEKIFYNYFQRTGSITDGQFSPNLIKDRHQLWIERLNFIEQHYPNLVDAQTAQILGAVYAAIIKLKNVSDYFDFRDEIIKFADLHKSDQKRLAQYNRKVKLHYYCYPLFYLYVKYRLK